MYMVFHAYYKLYIMYRGFVHVTLFLFHTICCHILMYYVLEHVTIDIFLV